MMIIISSCQIYFPNSKWYQIEYQLEFEKYDYDYNLSDSQKKLLDDYNDQMKTKISKEKMKELTKKVDEFVDRIDYKIINQSYPLQFYIDNNYSDCVGKALIFLAIIFLESGKKGQLLIYNTTDITNHCVPKINGKEYQKTGKEKNLLTTHNFDQMEYIFNILI